MGVPHVYFQALGTEGEGLLMLSQEKADVGQGFYDIQILAVDFVGGEQCVLGQLHHAGITVGDA